MIESFYLTSERPEVPPLRVGLLLDGLSVMAPFAAVIDHLLAASFVDLALVVLHDAETAPPLALPAWSAPLPRKLRVALHPEIRPNLLYTLYEKFDRVRNQGAAARLDEVDCTARLEGVPRLFVRPERKRFVHRFSEEALEQIRSYRLDVLLRFGFNILRGGILKAARYGVWSYHHGDNDSYRGGPAHFWEMVERNPVSGVMLQILSEELDAGRVLTKALASTASVSSEALNRVAPYAAGETMVIRKLWELHGKGMSHLEEHSLAAAPYGGRKAIYRRPSNTEMLGFGIRAGVGVLRNRLNPASPWAHWQLGVRPAADGASPGDMKGFRWLEAPPGRAQADPFLHDHEGVPWVFFEDFDYATERGELAAAPILADGSPGSVVPVMKRPYHLSYPFLWKQDGELFMIPESRANGRVELYRNRRFPNEWALEKVLFEGPGADTTVVEKNGQFWFFVSLKDPPGPEQLFLFSADSLTGQWKYHPANPISLDVRTARCGGNFLRRNGELWRVAQDGSRRYGYALRFQRVDVLDEGRYREEPGTFWEPAQLGVLGIHTFNCGGRWEFIDGQTARRQG